MTVSYYCRETKAGRNGLAPIQAAISINGERKFINLPLKYNPTQFKKEFESKRDNELKQYLSSYTSNINKAVMEMANYCIPLTHCNLREFLKNGGVKSYTIEDLFEEYLAILSNRIGKTISKGVYQKYINVRDIFFNHIDRNKEVTSITNSTILSFYTKLERDYKTSSSAGMMTKLKSFITFGMDNGYIKINPFASIRITRGTPKIEYLTEEEMGRLAGKDFGNDRLNRVRDIAVFQASTGLSYADMVNVSVRDIQEKNGVKFIKGRRQKTGIEYTAVILPDGLEVLERYEGRLPVLTNQKLNAYLKEIGDICGIEKELHTHLFRKTYATRLLQSCRAEVVQRCLGHSSTKITLSTYCKPQTDTILGEVGAAFGIR